MKNGWGKIEPKLMDYKINCAKGKWLHTRELEKLNNTNRKLDIIILACISITATSNLATNTIQFDYSKIFNIIYSVLLYITIFVKGFKENFKYEKEIEKNRTISLRYNTLYNNIDRILTLEEDYRDEATNYFEWVISEYDKIIMSSPDISKITRVEFEKEFKTPSKCTEDDDIKINMKSTQYINTTSDLKKHELEYELNRYMVNCLS